MPMRFDGDEASQTISEIFSLQGLRNSAKKRFEQIFNFNSFFLNEALDHLLLPLKKWIQPPTTVITEAQGSPT